MCRIYILVKLLGLAAMNAKKTKVMPYSHSDDFKIMIIDGSELEARMKVFCTLNLDLNRVAGETTRWLVGHGYTRNKFLTN